MGRLLTNRIPEDAPSHGACSQCGETRPSDAFYWYRTGRRNPWCKQCYSAQAKTKAATGIYKKRPDTIPCGGCMKPIETTIKNPTQRFCKPCTAARRSYQIKLRNAVLKATRSVRMNAEGRTCPHCAGPVVGRSNKAYCSETCNQAAHNATKKATWKTGERQERVSRAYIIARDRSRCHLCRKKCDPSEIHLDHLIPLSRGGTHDAANVRVACADCNLSKRADARNDQLMLVG